PAIGFDVVASKSIEQSFKNACALEFDLLERGALEDDIDGEPFVEVALFADRRIDRETEAVAIRLFRQGCIYFFKTAGMNVLADAATDLRFVVAVSNAFLELRQFLQLEARQVVLVCLPLFEDFRG